MLVQRGSAATPSPRLLAWLSVGVLSLVRALVQGLRRDPAVLDRSPTVDQLRLAYFAALETYAAQMDLHPIAHDPAMAGALDSAASPPEMPDDDGGDETDDDGSDRPDDPRLYRAVGAAYAAWKQAEAAPPAVAAQPPGRARGRRPESPPMTAGWRRFALVARQAISPLRAAHLLAVVRGSTQLSAVAVIVLAGVLFVAGRAVGDTIAYFTTSQDVTGTSLATAKQFALTDVAALAAPAGNIVLYWSGATWATNGYSVQRSAVSGGPYTEVGTTNASTFTFADTLANGLVNGTTYYYVVRGKSALNGTGLNSNQASARSDSAAPTVSSTTPANAATSVATNTTITVNFGEAMSQVLTVANFALVQCDGSACAVPGADVAGTTSWATATQLVFTPASNLAANTWFGIQLTAGSSGAADLAGNILSQTGCPHASGNDCYRTFRTAGAGVAAAVPPNGATGVGRNTNVSITFIGPSPSAAEKTSLQTGFSMVRTSNGSAVAGSFSWVGTTMTFNPSANLANNTNYTYTVVATTGDFNVNFTAAFDTTNSSDTTGPTGTGVTPADTSINQSPFTSVTMTFSGAMDPGVTAAAMSLSSQNPPSSTCPANTGPGPLTVSGAKSWFNSTTLIFTPYSPLAGGACYRVWVTQTAGGAADTAGNLLTGANTSTFTVGADMNVSQSPSGYGTVFYPGGSGQATGGGWTAGSGNVTARWDDVSTTQIGSAAPASGAVTIPLAIPSSATAGSHTITFNRSTGATVTRAVTVRQPTSLVLRANPSDIAAGGSTTLTATVYDNGQVAQNAGVSFSKVDPDARGTLGTPSNSGITDANGQVTVTLSASAGGTFQDITVTATSGSAIDSAVVVDPPPLPPGDLVLGAGPSGLTLSWRASPSRTVAGYRVSVGTASGRYGPSADAGSGTSYTYAAARPGTTYYAVVVAYSTTGALSASSAEASLVFSPPTPTATATTPAAATASPAATVPTQTTPGPNPSASRVPTTPSATPVPATATPSATPAPPTATAVALGASPTAILIASAASPIRLLAGSDPAAQPTLGPGSAAAATTTPSAGPSATAGTPTVVRTATPAGPTATATRATAQPTVAAGTPTPTPGTSAVGTPSPTAGTSAVPSGPSLISVLNLAAADSARASAAPSPTPASSGPTSAPSPTSIRLSTATPTPPPSPSPIVLILPTPPTSTPLGGGAPASQLYPSANQPTTSSSMPGATNALFPSLIQPSALPGGTGAAGLAVGSGTATPGTATPGTATPGTATPGTATPGTATPGTVTPTVAANGGGTPTPAPMGTRTTTSGGQSAATPSSLAPAATAARPGAQAAAARP